MKAPASHPAVPGPPRARLSAWAIAAIVLALAPFPIFYLSLSRPGGSDPTGMAGASAFLLTLAVCAAAQAAALVCGIVSIVSIATSQRAGRRALRGRWVAAVAILLVPGSWALESARSSAAAKKQYRILQNETEKSYDDMAAEIKRSDLSMAQRFRAYADAHGGDYAPTYGAAIAFGTGGSAVEEARRARDFDRNPACLYYGAGLNTRLLGSADADQIILLVNERAGLTGRGRHVVRLSGRSDWCAEENYANAVARSDAARARLGAGAAPR